MVRSYLGLPFRVLKRWCKRDAKKHDLLGFKITHPLENACGNYRMCLFNSTTFCFVNVFFFKWIINIWSYTFLMTYDLVWQQVQLDVSVYIDSIGVIQQFISLDMWTTLFKTPLTQSDPSVSRSEHYRWIGPWGIYVGKIFPACFSWIIRGMPSADPGTGFNVGSGFQVFFIPTLLHWTNWDYFYYPTNASICLRDYLHVGSR